MEEGVADEAMVAGWAAVENETGTGGGGGGIADGGGIEAGCGIDADGCDM